MKQNIQPNTTVTSKWGWCLWFTEEVWGTPHLFPTATDAWNATQFKHEDRNFPDVAVPVWFSWSVEGHVATRMPDGRVLSSPMTGTGSKWFNSVDECADEITRITGVKCTYLGWSEDIANVRVAEGGEMPVTTENVRDILGALWHIPANENDYKNAEEVDTNEWLRRQLDDPRTFEFADKANKAIDDVESLKTQVNDLKQQYSNLKIEFDRTSNIKDGVISSQQKEIESLKAQTGDNSKWETFKALIRELFN
jgi:hypothetical protein